MKVLIINSYAGSITLGARAYEAEIIGVFEDVGYGMNIQRANFGDDYNFIEEEAYWPDRIDLSNTVVLAHPPCSAFSNMNQKSGTKGVDAEAFACTTRVLNYACRNRAVAIGIESVIGTLSGAWKVHQDYATRFGYNLYRIMENGCMWGGQWRERFWVVYVKKGRANPNMTLTLEPKFQTVSEVIGDYMDDFGVTAGNQDKELDKQIDRMRDCGCSEEELDYFFKTQYPPHKGPLFKAIIEKRHPRMKRDEREGLWLAYMGGGWGEATMFYLHPDGLSPVLLGQSHWYYEGHNLSEEAFKLLMGFPAEYVFPDGPSRRNMRQLLSKGVMPPIVTWLCEQIDRHMKDAPQAAHGGQHYQIVMEPGQFADFRIKKRDWEQRERLLPPLRQSTDDLSENTDWAPRMSGRSTLDSYQFRLPFSIEESE